jgi:hypothetical protein
MMHLDRERPGKRVIQPYNVPDLKVNYIGDRCRGLVKKGRKRDRGANKLI